ncbi:ATP-binding protein [Haloarcula brevis]|uniref:ATP-binding protein n=1 Tax=Haloarcula brevis TaxID=3111453 RepID=UPI00300F128E
MSSPTDSSQRHVLCLPAEQDWNVTAEALSQHLPGATVEIVDTLAEAQARRSETVDCLISGFEVPGGTAVDLFDGAATDHPDPPVVLVADASDGTVPVCAVSEPFADVVPVTGDVDAAELAEVVDGVLPKTTDPDIAALPLPDSRAMNDWKADIFDQLFTEIPLHMFVKDARARHVVVSESAVDHRIHRQSDAYLGRRDIDGIVPDAEAAEPYEDDIAVIESGARIHNKVEYYAESERWFLTSKVPWESETGQSLGVLGIAQEITDRKERERQLGIINHLLRHNLRNKLNVISGRAEYLRDNMDAASEEVDCILNAAAELIEQLDKQQTILDIMVGEPDPHPVDLSTTLRSELELLARRYPDATIDSDVEDGVVGSATENISHAVAELVENAVVHSDRSEPRVEVTLEKRDDEVALRVADECAPIPQFEVAILTGRQSADQLRHSTGLGLWITRWVVKHADGTVSFDRIDGGNEVTVTVPTATSS